MRLGRPAPGCITCPHTDAQIADAKSGRARRGGSESGTRIILEHTSTGVYSTEPAEPAARREPLLQDLTLGT